MLVVVEAVTGTRRGHVGPVDDAHVRIRRRQGAELVVVARHVAAVGMRGHHDDERHLGELAHHSAEVAVADRPVRPEGHDDDRTEPALGAQADHLVEAVDERPRHDGVDAEAGPGERPGGAEHHRVAEGVAGDRRRRARITDGGWRGWCHRRGRRRGAVSGMVGAGVGGAVGGATTAGATVVGRGRRRRGHRSQGRRRRQDGGRRRSRRRRRRRDRRARRRGERVTGRRLALALGRPRWRSA